MATLTNTSCAPAVGCNETSADGLACGAEQIGALVDRCVRERTAALEAANRELDAFASSVSHELRGPLRTIDGFANLLRQSCADRMDREAQHYLTRIVAAQQRMANLLDALLILSRVEHANLACCEIDLREMLLQIIEELRARETHRIVEVRVEELPRIQGDPVLIRQAFENLLANAFKYTRARRIARIRVGSFHAEEQIVFFVRDNGAGFDMSQAGRLFGLFERLHAAEMFEGVGVGLALVKRIVGLHAGQVWAAGECDVGATLYVAIPRERHAPARGK